MKVKAHGKINLSLFVTGTRGKLHLIDSIMTTVSVFDEVTVTPADRVDVICENYELPPENNSAYMAARLIEEECGLKLSVRIKKGIPVGGGLGGSSADAAAVLWCANRLTGGIPDMRILSSRIGSDVYFMTKGGAARVRGTGDEILPFECLASFTALLIGCGEVSTPLCYKTFDKLGGSELRNRNDIIVDLLGRGETPQSRLLGNDLLPAAESLNPDITRARDLAAKLGVTACLTGSGGCVFILDAGESVETVFRQAGFPCRTVNYVSHGMESVPE